jgi:hypothetical protein
MERTGRTPWNLGFPITRRDGEYVAFDKFEGNGMLRTDPPTKPPGFAFDVEIFRKGNNVAVGGEARVDVYQIREPPAREFLPNVEAYACAHIFGDVQQATAGVVDAAAGLAAANAAAVDAEDPDEAAAAVVAAEQRASQAATNKMEKVREALTRIVIYGGEVFTSIIGTRNNEKATLFKTQKYGQGHYSNSGWGFRKGKADNERHVLLSCNTGQLYLYPLDVTDPPFNHLVKVLPRMAQLLEPKNTINLRTVRRSTLCDEGACAKRPAGCETDHTMTMTESDNELRYLCFNSAPPLSPRPHPVPTRVRTPQARQRAISSTDSLTRCLAA